LNAKDLKLLGKIVYSHDPKVARQLVQSVKRINNNREHQFTDIAQQFETFCLFFDLTKGFIIHPSSEERRARNEYIRIFLASMLHIYMPELFYLKKSGNLPIGLLQEISKCTNRLIPLLSQDVKKVIVMERTYADFRGHVENYLMHIHKPINR
jgi:hypothetical protein